MSKIKRALPEDVNILDKPYINQILIWEPRWHDRGEYVEVNDLVVSDIDSHIAQLTEQKDGE